MVDRISFDAPLWVKRHRLSYSVVTRAELFASNTATDLSAPLLAPFRELDVNRAIAERAGRIVRELRTRLPDALVAATAVVRVRQDVGLPFDAELAARIRQRLDGSDVREVAMFGGRSFMVHDQLAVCAASDGTLLLRCAPDEADILVQRAGARTAEMRGRAMSRGWLRVDIDTLDDDAALHEWIDVAVAYAERRANAS